jgi:hypothetical protein
MRQAMIAGCNLQPSLGSRIQAFDQLTDPVNPLENSTNGLSLFDISCIFSHERSHALAIILFMRKAKFADPVRAQIGQPKP